MFLGFQGESNVVFVEVWLVWWHRLLWWPEVLWIVGAPWQWWWRGLFGASPLFFFYVFIVCASFSCFLCLNLARSSWLPFFLQNSFSCLMGFLELWWGLASVSMLFHWILARVPRTTECTLSGAIFFHWGGLENITCDAIANQTDTAKNRLNHLRKHLKRPPDTTKKQQNNKITIKEHWKHQRNPNKHDHETPPVLPLQAARRTPQMNPGAGHPTAAMNRMRTPSPMAAWVRWWFLKPRSGGVFFFFFKKNYWGRFFLVSWVFFWRFRKVFSGFLGDFGRFQSFVLVSWGFWEVLSLQVLTSFFFCWLLFIDYFFFSLAVFATVMLVAGERIKKPECWLLQGRVLMISIFEA